MGPSLHLAWQLHRGKELFGLLAVFGLAELRAECCGLLFDSAYWRERAYDCDDSAAYCALPALCLRVVFDGVSLLFDRQEFDDCRVQGLAEDLLPGGQGRVPLRPGVLEERCDFLHVAEGAGLE